MSLPTFAFCLLLASAAAVDISTIHDDINKALNDAIDEFVADLPNQAIDNIEGSEGRIKYSITNNRVTSFTRGTAKVDIKKEGSVIISLAGFGVSAEGNWRYKYRKGFIKIRDSGRYRASAGGVALSTTVAIDVDENGKISLRQTACAGNVDGLRMKLRGGASWLYNMFLKKVVRRFKGKLGGIVCKKLGKVIAKQSDKIPPIGMLY
ncbi:hypothetical protein CAPTEDRAFT_219444 [Capitella teleta]|uniref:Lipid-binding serum glycoprotein N-terminal domain-containing protein n=1 Tax=Capitella teleta TaxID=283909 RepID=R7V9N8_CAPTE|nr:hypothetical protein CAPTEDRAFT_219444 [Capitella teleta]|eukprot:ELU15192.1 hypothetical protein CAPTEDRAFT_219444 [Capitella teleta]